MGARRSRRALAATLALLVATAGPPSAGRAAEGVPPDLEIKYVGQNPENGAEQLFRVTNVGRWWVGETRASVHVFVGPNYPGIGGIRVPDLGPKGDPDTASEFEFAYEAPCSQGRMQLKAELTTAKDWAGDEETNLANNTWEDWICQPQQAGQPPAQPAPAGAGTGSGDQTLTLQPSALKSTSSYIVLSALGADNASSSFEVQPLVGWGQSEGKGVVGADRVQVSETAVRFDLSALDKIPRKLVGKAVLVYDEAASNWTDGAGNGQMKPGCVAVLGTATTDWAQTGAPAAQFPNELHDTAPNGSTREWNVATHVNRQLAFREDASLRHGFVLRGGMNLNQLTGDDDTNCVSRLSNIRLVITYVALGN